MTTAPLERPDNPWGDPAVIWKADLVPDEDTDDPYRIYHEVLADPTRSHVVREIEVNASMLPDGTPRTKSEAEDLIGAAEKEFNLLGSIGVEVARPDWHVTESATGHILILARTPIVDGQHPTTDSPTGSHVPVEARFELNAQLDYYYMYAHKPGQAVLTDIEHGDQYVYGTYRFPELVGRNVPVQPILVDPDLIMVTFKKPANVLRT